MKIGEREENTIQHSGLGRKLMHEAEKIAKEDFDARKLLVISAVGTREYYKKLGYSLDGPYMSKQLREIMTEQKIIGKGTWIDKLAFELIEREKHLGRNTDLISCLLYTSPSPRD